MVRKEVRKGSEATHGLDDAQMSDVTLLVSVEDLINMTLGPPDRNLVNFKLLQTVLHIFARELRVLETRVDLRICEKQDSSSSSSKRDGKSSPGKNKAEMAALKEQAKAEKAAMKEKDKEEKTATKVKAKEEKATMKEKEKEEKTATKVKAKEEKATMKEKEKEEKTAMKEKAKEEKATMKEKEKEEKTAMKEKAKEEKAAMKEKEAKKGAVELEMQRIEEEALAKMSPSAKKAYLKQKELENKELAKMSPKEKETFLKNKIKELNQMGKMTPKQVEDYIKEKEANKQKTDLGTESSITVSESRRDNEKILIVEKSSKRPGARLGSIEVVTLSQFELLESAVQKLSRVAGPLPTPSLPDNNKLRFDLARGSASLTDTMEAMQISARVQTAEKGINQLADLLTQLAMAGALPMEITAVLEELKAEMNDITRATLPGEAKSLAAVSLSTKSAIGGKMTGRSSGRSSVAVVSVISQASSGVTGAITKTEMEDAIDDHTKDIMRNVTQMTQKLVANTETAVATIKGVLNKVDTAMKLDKRVTTLFSLASDYTDQLGGLGEGLTSQVAGFRDQMMQMRSDLSGGLLQLGNASSSSETAAVMELRERFVALTIEMDGTVTMHQGLAGLQNQLTGDMRGLIDAVEMLREQKADRDEVLDGLRDKADKSKLGGLMTEVAFMKAREELDHKLDMCHEKFRKQDCVWMNALQELKEVAEVKAELIQLYSMREETQDALKQIEDQMHVLSVYLGQPKAAILTRMLSKNATCGTCRVPALMDQEDAKSGKPPLLPALRPPDEEPCVPEWTPSLAAGDANNIKMHMCHRWVGGSHTMLSSSIVPEEPDPLPVGVPVKKYPGYGSDGRLYMLEDELQPCIECNAYPAPAEAIEDDKYCRCGPPKHPQ